MHHHPQVVHGTGEFLVTVGWCSSFSSTSLWFISLVVPLVDLLPPECLSDFALVCPVSLWNDWMPSARAVSWLRVCMLSLCFSSYNQGPAVKKRICCRRLKCGSKCSMLCRFCVGNDTTTVFPDVKHWKSSSFIIRFTNCRVLQIIILTFGKLR